MSDRIKPQEPPRIPKRVVLESPYGSLDPSIVERNVEYAHALAQRYAPLVAAVKDLTAGKCPDGGGPQCVCRLFGEHYQCVTLRQAIADLEGEKTEGYCNG